MDSLKGDHQEFIKNNKLIFKTQERFRRKRHNVLTEEMNKIVLTSNNAKRIQSIDSVQTYASGTSKYIVCKKEEIKCSNKIKQDKND